MHDAAAAVVSSVVVVGCAGPVVCDGSVVVAPDVAASVAVPVASSSPEVEQAAGIAVAVRVARRAWSLRG